MTSSALHDFTDRQYFLLSLAAKLGKKKEKYVEDRVLRRKSSNQKKIAVRVCKWWKSPTVSSYLCRWSDALPTLHLDRENQLSHGERGVIITTIVHCQGASFEEAIDGALYQKYQSGQLVRAWSSRRLFVIELYGQDVRHRRYICKSGLATPQNSAVTP